MTSKTQQALEWLDAHPEMTAYAAARKFNLSPAAVYQAQARPRCSHCGGYIKGVKVGSEKKKSARTVKTREELKDLLG